MKMQNNAWNAAFIPGRQPFSELVSRSNFQAVAFWSQKELSKHELSKDKQASLDWSEFPKAGSVQAARGGAGRATWPGDRPVLVTSTSALAPHCPQTRSVMFVQLVN